MFKKPTKRKSDGEQDNPASKKKDCKKPSRARSNMKEVKNRTLLSFDDEEEAWGAVILELLVEKFWDASEKAAPSEEGWWWREVLICTYRHSIPSKWVCYPTLMPFQARGTQIRKLVSDKSKVAYISVLDHGTNSNPDGFVFGANSGRNDDDRMWKGTLSHTRTLLTRQPYPVERHFLPSGWSVGVARASLSPLPNPLPLPPSPTHSPCLPPQPTPLPSTWEVQLLWWMNSHEK